MIRKYWPYFLVISLFTSCKSFKKELYHNGGKQEAIYNAIIDFANSSRLFKKDSIFSVWAYDTLYQMILVDVDNQLSKWIPGTPYEGIMAVSILGMGNSHKFAPIEDSLELKELRGIPSRYLIVKGRLFYWFDDNYLLTQSTLDIYNRYDLLLEFSLDNFMEYSDQGVDDSEEGADYYFCRNNLTNYKRRTNSLSLGYYDPPKMQCK